MFKFKRFHFKDHLCYFSYVQSYIHTNWSGRSTHHSWPLTFNSWLLAFLPKFLSIWSLASKYVASHSITFCARLRNTVAVKIKQYHVRAVYYRAVLHGANIAHWTGQSSGCHENVLEIKGTVVPLSSRLFS